MIVVVVVVAVVEVLTLGQCCNACWAMTSLFTVWQWCGGGSGDDVGVAVVAVVHGAIACAHRRSSITTMTYHAMLQKLARYT